MRVLIISPSLEEIGGRGLHSITNNIVNALNNSGDKVGLLVGLPNHRDFKGSKGMASKVDHVFLQHYLTEGTASFKYVISGGYSRFNVFKAIIKKRIYKSRFVKIDQDLVVSKKSILGSMDYVIQSPFFYQLLVRNKDKQLKKILTGICKRHNIDLIISTSPALIYSKWFHNTRVVQFVHDFMPLEVLETPPDNDTPIRFAEQIYAACYGSDLLLANSMDTKSKIIDANPEAKVKVLYGAVSLPKDSGSTVLDQKSLKKDHYLVFASALEKRKNLENIMIAYSKVMTKIQNIPLIIIGSAGYGFDSIYNSYNNLPKEVQDNIIFTGYISKEDKDNLFINARACIFTTIYEGLGLPIVEALASGTPVLATRVGASPEAGRDAALYVDNPYDINQIAEGIQEIVTNEDLRKKLMSNAPQVVEFFSEKNFNRRLKEVVDLLNNKKG